MLFPRLYKQSHSSLVAISSLSSFIAPATTGPTKAAASLAFFSPTLAQQPSWRPLVQHTRSLSTSSPDQAGKYIFHRRTHRSHRDNTPFLVDTPVLNAIRSNKEMPTNKDRPTKAERKQRARDAPALRQLANGVSDKYTTWSREALLQRIRELEGTATATASSSTTPIPAHLTGSDTSSIPGSPITATDSGEPISRPESPSNNYSPIETPRKKDRRPFDFSKYAKRHVAFRVAYFGWPYGGFASQGVNEIKTVESEIFNALMAARIIDDPLTCNYSRCGRTDRGVSGLGQVIALTVRSSLPKSSPHVIRSEGDGYVPETPNPDGPVLTQEEQEAKEGVYWKRGIKRNKDGSVFGELAYLNIINRLLPPDIRIVAWAPVSEDFNARFHCSWRQYKYFFPKGIIDIERMRTAAVKFLGTHDFRNFCKYDASKTIENYDRTIHEISIEPVPEHEFASRGSNEFYQLTLKGSAFLWHQVRCMMAVLFCVGQGLEEPDIIDKMMDLKQCPAKPNYDMASDLPLVLYDCHFENLEWQYQTEVDLVNDITPLRLYRAMEDQWSCYVTKSLMYSRMLQVLDKAMLQNLPEKGQQILLGDYAEQNAIKENNISLGGDLRMFMGKRYSGLMDRKKCLPTEVKAARHQEKKRIRLALESEANSANNSGNTSEVDSPAVESVATMEGPSAEVASSSSSFSAPTEATGESASLQLEEKSS
ncbi:tRNA pseudouridine synthase 3 [Podila verticillata]|nr:tRNA pseudouridine synthase 3 [Podila verticillata]KAF9389733.1 tRNA pseudouridine synthase 3 [Podila verticillata]KAI9242474.1 MAG: pseudouridine synthase [Podila humilis]